MAPRSARFIACVQNEKISFCSLQVITERKAHLATTNDDYIMFFHGVRLGASA